MNSFINIYNNILIIFIYLNFNREGRAQRKLMISLGRCLWTFLCLDSNIYELYNKSMFQTFTTFVALFFQLFSLNQHWWSIVFLELPPISAGFTQVEAPVQCGGGGGPQIFAIVLLPPALANKTKSGGPCAMAHPDHAKIPALSPMESIEPECHGNYRININSLQYIYIIYLFIYY